MAEEAKTRKLILSKLPWIFLILVIIALLSFYMFHSTLDARLESRIEKIHAQGYPVTLKELNDSYSIGLFEDNAADKYLEAFAYLPDYDADAIAQLPVLGKLKPKRTKAIEPNVLTMMSDFISDNQKVFDLLDEAVSIEKCRYPVDFTQGVNALMPYLSETRKSAQIVALKAYYEIERGNIDNAIDDIEMMYHIGESLAEEPLLISQLVRMSLIGLTSSVTERLINRTDLDETQITRIEKLFSKHESFNIKKGLVGERCFAICYKDLPLNELVAFSPNDHIEFYVSSIFYRLSGLHKAGLVRYLDYLEKGIESFDKPVDDWYKNLDMLYNEYRKIDDIHKKCMFYSDYVTGAYELNTNVCSSSRAVKTALAIERFKLKQQNLVDDLSQLVPEYLKAIPKDPFDGNDIRYKKLDTGYVVYSVGKNAKDDGGTEKADTKDDNYDLTFTVEK